MHSSNVVNGNFPQAATPEAPAVVKCSMCGQEAADGVAVISNQSFHICAVCVNEAHELLATGPVKLNGDFRQKTPSKIVEFINQYVIGQDQAKQTLALAIYNHFKRISHPEFDGVELQKSNILMIGPSGTGKTYLVQSIARFLDIPFAIADATSLTEAGFVGEDVESMLQSLIQAADGNIEKAKTGIIFLDEIDKIAKKTVGASTEKDPGGEGVQQAILKIIEGTQSRVLKSGSRKTSKDPMDVLDTSQILFICGGAFVGLDDIMAKNNNTTATGIGFGATVDKAEPMVRNPEPEDLYEFGMLHELVGRLPVICTLNELDVQSLATILVEPKNSVVKQFQALVRMEGVELEFEPAAVQKIAQLAYARKTGARGLRSIVEGVLNTCMFNLPDKQNVAKIVVSLNNDTIEVIEITKD